MSVKRNSIANYFNQIYTILISIAVSPIYLKYLGAEAYGLVGFFTLLQVLMGILDLGLSPTLARQIAHVRGAESGLNSFYRLLRSFELIFLALSILIFLSTVLSSYWLASSWIKAESIESESIIYCISLIGLALGFRFFSSLYRSGINGLEDQVWLSIANIFIVSARFIGSLLLIIFFNQSIEAFFEYQVFISICELAIFGLRFYRTMPKASDPIGLIYFDRKEVSAIAPFALSIAFSTGVWLLASQADKLILSSVLTLSEFGYFNLVTLVAGGIAILSAPISQAIIPRMTLLLAKNDQQSMLELYRKSSQIVALISFSVALTIGFYAEPLLYAWTGDAKAAAWGAEILVWMSLGNAVVSLTAFQYHLQVAFGELRLHVLGSAISAVIQVPMIIWVAISDGALGAVITILAFRIVWFLAWTPIIHRHFIPGFHLTWMIKDILPTIIAVVGLSSAIFFIANDHLSKNRTILLVELFVIGAMGLFLSAMLMRNLRADLLSTLHLLGRKLCG